MFKKIARIYLKIAETICVILLAIIMVCMCIQIGCRLLTIGQNFTDRCARLDIAVYNRRLPIYVLAIDRTPMICECVGFTNFFSFILGICRHSHHEHHGTCHGQGHQ